MWVPGRGCVGTVGVLCGGFHRETVHLGWVSPLLLRGQSLGRLEVAFVGRKVRRPSSFDPNEGKLSDAGA